MNFDSHVSGVVRVAAALVNVVTPGERQGRAYAPPTGTALSGALGAALRQGYRGAGEPAAGVCGELVALGATARPVFAAVEAGDLDGAAALANGLLETYAPTPILARHDGEPWHLHFHGPPRRDPSEWGGGVAVALATVLGSAYADRLGICAAPACDRVFVDVSRNGTRRFCTTGCQNRVKAAAHRARQRLG